ncbi:glycine betaine ABC transporter substrate-binding protein [Haloarcula litorea]|uniref:ABC transporter substrate-binding protein n=1 Tax=Haloarcula litorea TaxID=3032579 RepID=UPI0023E7834E|nr:glycine betaine ABC transporter substrate-binding protein [Halomicroarcula sp. GDY20]
MPPMRRRFLGQIGRAGGVAVTGILSGCAKSEQPESESVTVRIGSKPFTEQKILSYLAYERLRRIDWIRAVDEIGAGNSLSNWEATASGDQHLYWEYTGTAWLQLPPRHDRRITDPESLFERVQADADSQRLQLADPAPFSNEYVIAADARWAEQTEISTISDLAAHIRNGGDTPGVAVNEEFFHRQDGWRGLASYYEIETANGEPIQTEPFIVTSIGLTYELLEQGRVQITSGFATDPQLNRSTVTVLEDDRDYFLPYQPAPTAYAPLIDEHPEVFEILSPVGSALDKSIMRNLNSRVLLDGEHPFAVATQFLEGEVLDDA